MGGPEVGVLLVWFVFWAVVGGLVGYAIGNGKGRGTEGFWLGFLLGFIGWIIVALMAPSAEYEQQRAAIAGLVSAAASGVVAAGPGTTRACPWCAEQIRGEARVCRFCGRDVEPNLGRCSRGGS